MGTQKIEVLPVSGYLARNWPGLNDTTPAVVVNPDAKPLDLLAWCWGELASLERSAEVISAVNDDVSDGDVAGIFLHRLQPLCRVLEQAIDALWVAQ